MTAKQLSKNNREPSSFRDNYGYVYREQGSIRRVILPAGQASYDFLMSNGLYDALIKRKLLIPHREMDDAIPDGGYKVIEPETVSFISYPYEWSFSQLSDAALATLEIQKLALTHGMSLRDASAYNIQFVKGRACLIDTLSFDKYTPGSPWIAYRQFCQHFLAPLTLASHKDPRLMLLMRDFIDGIPLQLAAQMLPVRSRISPRLALHIGMHARFERQYEYDTQPNIRPVSLVALRGVIDSLERTIKGLRLGTRATQWGDYYDHTNYSDNSLEQKSDLVASLAKRVGPKRVLDLGSNNGLFSRVLARNASLVISADVDPLAVEANYLQMKRAKETSLMPLLIDLTNPSPALGWSNQERSSFTNRAQSDLVVALALIHHLSIAANIPLGHVAEYFASLASHLIIEFVPKTDSQVQRLLATREDIFSEYTTGGFEAAFGQYYKITAREPVPGSKRLLYLMERL